MKVLILSFSNNIVDEDSFIPNKKGLTLSCVEVCEEELKQMGYKVEYICMNKRRGCVFVENSNLPAKLIKIK